MHAPQHYKVISDQANVRANTSVDQLDKCIQVEICRQTSERLSVLHIGVSLLEACTSIQVEIRCQTSERRLSGLHTGVSSQQRVNTKQLIGLKKYKNKLMNTHRLILTYR